MALGKCDEEILDELGESYVQRMRAGERPDVSEYVARHPELADAIRATFAALALLEDARRTPSDTPTMAAAKIRELAQSEIGDYRVLSELGRGGMGVVYEARDTKLNRLVALKLVHSERSEASERFLREAQAAAELKHPGIVQVHHFGEWQAAQDDPPFQFLVLEHVEGGSLASRLHRALPTPTEAAKQLRSLTEAVAFAHQHGLVHRDLKPSNVLVASDGTLKITDFGLVKRMSTASEQTQTGAIVGTPSYVAPEQTSVDGQVGPAADVYGLGAILYESLTGRAPFRGATVLDTLEQVRNCEPVPPRRLQPGCPRDLETICLKCLRKEPSRRYAGAEELAADLDAFLGGRPIQARPVSRRERLVKWSKRHPARLALVLTSGLAILLSLSAGLAWMRAAQRQQLLDAQTDKRKLSEKNVKLEKERVKLERALKEAARSRHYGTLISLAHTEILGNDVARAQQRLADCPADLRHWEWRYLKRLCDASVLTFRGHKGSVHSVAIHPDGKLAASASTVGKADGWGETLLWRIDSGEVIYSWKSFGFCNVAFHPGGTLLAGTVGNDVRLWDVSSGRVLPFAAQHQSTVTRVAYSPDGNLLASASVDKTIRVWEVSSGRQLTVFNGHATAVYALAFDRNGNRVASGDALGKVKVWDAATGTEPQRSPRGHAQPVRSVLFTPNGRRLLSSTMPAGRPRLPDVRAFSTRNWGEYRAPIFPGPTSPVYALATNRDGQLLAGACWDNTVGVWDSKQRRYVVYRGHVDAVRDVAFHPDGTRLASASQDGTVKIWNVTSDPDCTRLRFSGVHSVDDLAFSPDGKRLAACGEGTGAGQVKIWNAATGKELRTIRHKNCGVVRSIAFHPDGERLAIAGFNQAEKTGEIHVCDSHTGARLLTLKGHTELLSTVAFSPDGRWLASAAADKKIKIWDVETGEEQLSLPGHRISLRRCMAFHPTKPLLAAVRDNGAIALWDIRTKQIVMKIRPVETTVSCVAFDPQGRFLTADSGIDRVAVWDVETGALHQTLRGFTKSVTGLAFSPDGKRLVVCTSDSQAYVWDVTVGQLLIVLKGGAQCAAFSPDGEHIACGTTTGIVHVWKTGSEDVP